MLTAACSPFITVEDLPEDCVCNVADAELIDFTIDGASDTLALLTGFAWFGVCERTVRPCRCCYCGVCPSCCEADAIPLRGPVIEVSEVKIDGDVVPSDEYRLIARNRIIRLDPDNGWRHVSWPSAQNLYAPLTEDHTFGITYSFGHDPMPQFVKDATIELVCDLLASKVPNQRGKLPPSTTSVFYQGVQATRQTAAEAIREGQTYLPKVAMLLGLTAGRQAGAYSPDGISSWAFPLD
jgi:hypothetical protein